MRVTTKLKKILVTNNIEVKMDDFGLYEIYLFNKIDKTVCVINGKNWNDAITKCLNITKKYDK